LILLFLRRINHREHADYRALPVITGIVIAALIFSVWGLASIMHTAPGKLAESTIPFTVAARKIFGQNGRLVMGVVLIAGTAGVVNALFIGVSRMLSGMAMEGLLPHWMKGVEKRSAIPLMLISGGIAILMAMGVAGETEIVLYMKAGLFLWLLHYAAVFLSLLVLGRRLQNGPQPFKKSGPSGIIVIALVVIIAILGGLLWAESESAALLKFMLIILTVTFVFSIIWKLFVNRGGEVS
jgi:amino acid transporter